jgi:AraC-like DNA-binding protein
LLAYATFGPVASATVEGIRVRAGMMVIAEPRTEAGFVVDPGYESITLLVRPEDLREHLSARKREGEFRSPRRVEVLRADPTLARALFRMGKRLTTTASRRPELFEEGRAERDAAQEELLEALLAAMDTAETLKPVGNEITRQAHSRIVTMAEHHALQCHWEHLHVSELCRATGVSERTLQCAFKEIMGLSPVAYLIRLRLHRVRAAPQTAERRSTRVSTEGLKWGFWHFGEFSRAYKQCFGESPSATLRRMAGMRDPGGNTVATS